MKKIIIVTALVLFTLLGCNKSDKRFSFYSAPERGLLSTRQIEPVKGVVYVYATFEMGPVNPIEYVNGKPVWRPESAKEKAKVSGELEADSRAWDPEKIWTEQKKLKEVPEQLRYLDVVTLGQQDGAKFIPAIRFGLGNDNRVGLPKARITPWATNEAIHYFGMHARPDTSYDFKIKLDLNKDEMTIFVSGRGDDKWFLMAEDVPLINNVEFINKLEVKQYPNSPAIENLRVLSKPWRAGEKVHPHRLAKKDRVVARNKGFKFQSMRSVWSEPGRHVTVARKQGYHMAFTDVVNIGDGHLACVWENASHTGGSFKKRLISHSYDSGKSWSEMEYLPAGWRIQKLKDGSLLLGDRVGHYRSDDEGKTWKDAFTIDPTKAGGNKLHNPSHIAELPDGSWLVAGTYNPGKKFKYKEGSRMEFYRSTDQGQNWQFWSDLLVWPPFSFNEPEIVVLPDDRLAVFVRESRNDGFPGVKAISEDNGKTWKAIELPYVVMGRTCAKPLPDGRILFTTRSQVGRCSLWGWVGDIDDRTPYKALGVHFNDRSSVGLKNDALHIDSDGVRGQYSCYLIRPIDSMQTKIDITAEVKVLRNDGHAATIGVPFVGKIRIYPDRLEFAHDESVKAPVTPGEFHIYRIIRDGDIAKVYIDGKLVIETDKCDRRTRRSASSPTTYSAINLSFGNEMQNVEPHDLCTVFPQHIPREVTGYSIWRRVEVILDDPATKRRVISWSAKRDGFPDQYQLDNIIEIDGSIAGMDQGYSGWVLLDDGRIFVVNYTDDTAGAIKPDYFNLGVPYIRGTFLEISDLPPIRK